MTTGMMAADGINMALATEKCLFPHHEPIGKGQGIYPGRVVWMHNPEAVHWNGQGFWWEPVNFNQGHVLTMIRNGIMRLSGTKSPAAAWKALFEWRNRQNGKSGPYKKGQKIALKPNMNGSGEYGNDLTGRVGASYGNAVVLRAILLSLVEDGQVSPQDITIYDTGRIFPDYLRKLCTDGPITGVNFSQRDPSGVTDAQADKDTQIHWAGPVRGKATFLPKCLTEATYLINLATLKGHCWGMTLCAKNHFGTIINEDRLRTPQAAGLHENIINGQFGDYSVLADLMAQKQIGAKTILWMLDALITPPDESSQISMQNSRWQQPPFNGDFVSSLFFSLDPIAIDSVGADFLANEPTIVRHNGNFSHKRAMENYLHEAALLDNPPSGAKYTAGKDKIQDSLGVHEHWNNIKDRLYGRNLGKSVGIELIKN